MNKMRIFQPNSLKKVLESSDIYLMNTVRTMSPGDWPDVQRIYAQGIATENATFETSTPDWDNWDRSHMDSCRLVAENIEGHVVGWAALSPVSDRCVYGGVGEVSIYTDLSKPGSGIGSMLMQELVIASEENGIWTLHAAMFRENLTSQALHKKFGFREIGYREKIGKLNGVWRDTILMERRSKNIL